jgi:hypothetical protein
MKQFLLDLVKEAINQITHSPKRLEIGKKCREQMQKEGLSEEDVRDAFYHGEPGYKENMLIRKYPKYEILLFYKTSSFTGNYMVTFATKRPRQ